MPIDLNSATREELANLECVGPQVADAIISARPFSSMEELVPVLGEAALSLISDQGVAVGAVPAASTAPETAFYYENLGHFRAFEAGISDLLPDDATAGLVFSFPGMLAALKLGLYFHVKKCTPTVAKLKAGATKCYKVSVASTSAATTTVDIAWTQANNVVVNDNGNGAGRETQCRCNVKQVQIHAQNGDASVAVIRC